MKNAECFPPGAAANDNVPATPGFVTGQVVGWTLPSSIVGLLKGFNRSDVPSCRCRARRRPTRVNASPTDAFAVWSKSTQKAAATGSSTTWRLRPRRVATPRSRARCRPTRPRRASGSCLSRGLSTFLAANAKVFPLMNLSWPNPAVVETLGKDVQGLLTGQKTVAQTLADLDAAWGVLKDAACVRIRGGHGRPGSPTQSLRVRSLPTHLSDPSAPPQAEPPGCRGSGSSRRWPSSSRFPTSRRGRHVVRVHRLGRLGDATWSGSTTSARFWTTPPRAARSKNTIVLAFSFVVTANVIGLGVALALHRTLKSRGLLSDLRAGRDELARGLLRLAVHLQLHRPAQHVPRQHRTGVVPAPLDGRPDLGAVDDLRRPRGSSSASRWSCTSPASRASRKRLDEASAVDGASTFRQFRKITLALRSGDHGERTTLGVFDQVLAVTGGAP